jgi:hypothetical protein
MTHPMLAIVIPVYNTAPYLNQCITSALNQGIEDIEVHCFENGSSDASPQVLAEWEKRDARVIVHNILNNEWSDIQSTELTKPIKCDYLYRMDSDDYLESGFLGKVLPIMDEEKLDMLFFEGESLFETEDISEAQKAYYEKAYRYDDVLKDTMSGKDAFIRMRSIKKFYPSMCMYICRKSFLEEFEPPVFTPRILSEGDNYVTMFRLLSARSIRIVHEVGYYRRLRPKSMMMGKRSATDTLVMLLAITAVATERTNDEDIVTNIIGFVADALKFIPADTAVGDISFNNPELRHLQFSNISHLLLKAAMFNAEYARNLEKAAKASREKYDETLYWMLRNEARVKELKETTVSRERYDDLLYRMRRNEDHIKELKEAAVSREKHDKGQSGN